MDHNQALKNQAVERYLLRAMSEDEQDQFEEHYFTCTECAADIRSATRLQEAARQFFITEPHEQPARRSWWSFPTLVPSLASVALLGVVIFQASNHEFEGAQPVAMVALASATRGSGDVARIPQGGPYFMVYFDLPPAPPSTLTYEGTVTNASGKAVSVSEIVAPKPGVPANLLFKRSDFPPGPYRITVRDVAKSVVLELNFILE